MTKPTAHEYYSAVNSIAAGIIEEVGTDEYAEYSDAVHEWVDGSQWVIYTYRAQLLLTFSSNSDAGPDEIGWEGLVSGCDGWSDLYSRGAYFAMCADVSEAIDRILDEAAA
jgi:hypothetical protein